MSEEKIFNAYLDGERPAHFRSLSGLELRADYGADVVEAEKPGAYPFTRGIHDEMYRKRLWTRRQQSGFGTPADSNERLLYLLRQGQTGLNVDFDVATKLGIDPDHPLGEGDVGLQGTSIATLEDMAALFEGIPQDKVSSTLIAQPPASAVIVAMYLLVARQRGLDPSSLLGTIMNCAMTQLVGPTYQANTHFFPIDFSLRVGLDVMEYCARQMPKWNVVNLNAYNIRECGVNAIEEAAYSLLLASEYIERLLARGLEVDSFAPRIAFFCAAHIDLFEEVAKLRAMRRIWAKLLRQRYGAGNERSMWFRAAIQTSALPLTAQQPLNNIARSTVQTLAAVLAGTQSIHTTSYDEPFALPTEESHTLSLRTQQILAYEANVVKTVDPLGGSYFVEQMTDQLEERITALMDDMRKRGGYIELFKQGWIEEQLNRSRIENMTAMESGDHVSVGVNAFRDEDEAPPDLRFFRMGREMIEGRIAYIRDYRARRDNRALATAMESVRQVAAGTENLLPAIIAAVEAGATLGELCDCFREAIAYTPPSYQRGAAE